MGRLCLAMSSAVCPLGSSFGSGSPCGRPSWSLCLGPWLTRMRGHPAACAVCVRSHVALEPSGSVEFGG